MQATMLVTLLILVSQVSPHDINGEISQEEDLPHDLDLDPEEDAISSKSARGWAVLCKIPPATVVMSEGDQVILESPKYPKNYPRGKNCGWKLEAQGANPYIRFNVSCDPFEVRKGEGDGCKDYLRLDEEKFCGKGLEHGPMHWLSSSNILDIWFHSSKKKKNSPPRVFKCTATAYKFGGEAPMMTLYTSIDQTGVKFTATGPYYDLRIFNFNNVTKSICGRGLWFLYDVVGFQWYIGRSTSASTECQNLDPFFWDRLSAIRYVGAEDMSMQTLTAYRDSHMSGGIYVAVADIDYLLTFNDVASSIAIMGDSAWTLYTDSAYRGVKVCFIPTEVHGLVNGFWNLAETPVGDDNLAAIRKGCHSDTILMYDPSTPLS